MLEGVIENRFLLKVETQDGAFGSPDGSGGGKSRGVRTRGQSPSDGPHIDGHTAAVAELEASDDDFRDFVGEGEGLDGLPLPCCIRRTSRLACRMKQSTAQDSFDVALRHYRRVDAAWDDPTDWAILSLFGFFCLEACVVAATLHQGWKRPNQHWEKQQVAERLTRECGLPDIGDLLVMLNDMRKHEAYGDVDRPEGLDAEDIAYLIEDYVESVRRLLQL